MHLGTDFIVNQVMMAGPPSRPRLELFGSVVCRLRKFDAAYRKGDGATWPWLQYVGQALLRHEFSGVELPKSSMRLGRIRPIAVSNNHTTDKGMGSIVHSRLREESFLTSTSVSSSGCGQHKTSLRPSQQTTCPERH